MKKLLLLVLLGFCAPVLAHAQMPKWYNPPVVFDWESYTSTTVGSGPTSVNCSNAAYDENGDILIFTDWFNTFSATSNLFGMYYGSYELNIIKVPKTCKDYYVIYSDLKYDGGAKARYARLNWNGTDWVTSGPIELPNALEAGWCNIAVSKQMNNNKDRFLFVSGMGKLHKYLISHNGISFVNTITDIGDCVFFSNEGELYEDGNGYKYITGEFYNSNPGYRLGIVNLDINGNYVSKQNFLTDGKIVGIEAVSGNQVLFSKRMTGTIDAGIYSLNVATGVITTVVNTTNGGTADIEKALDGKFYTQGVSGSGRKLLEIDPVTLTATMTNYDYNNGQVSPIDIYKFVDQVDNEDYTAANISNNQADLMIADNAQDVGIEPLPNALPWAEGSIWNCHNTNNNCIGNQNPRSQQTEYMKVRVTNRGCVKSSLASLHIYWTRARSGEVWKDHWFDPSAVPTNTINGYPGGGEITVLPGTSTSTPLIIPQLNPGQSITLTQEWVAPNRAWYSLIPGIDDGVNPMICYLGRIVSANDPMYNEQVNINVDVNVRNNNNIASRNSFLLPVTIGHPVTRDGSFLINNLVSETRNISGIRLTGLNIGSDIKELQSVDLELEPALYTRWVNNGKMGNNIIDLGSNIIRITDYNSALIDNLNILPGEAFTLVPIVTLVPNTKLTVHSDLYKFMINHYYADKESMSMGIYDVQFEDDNVANTNKNNNMVTPEQVNDQPVLVRVSDQPVVSPNPTSGILNIRYNNMLEGAAITLFDNLGRKVQSNVLSAKNSSINISLLPAGTYFYQLINGREIFKGKVTKK